MQPPHRCQQDVHVAGFDLLDRADVQIHQLGQLLLRDFFSHPFPADIAPERLELRGLF